MDASFPTTQWSMVLTAGSSAQANGALAALCREYWYPLYAYVRRQGHRCEDAQDLTQEFFARFLERKYLSHADPGRGRFRSFLLTSLKHFLINEWERERTLKRGRGDPPVSWDARDAEDRFLQEPTENLTPDKAYEQQWANTLLQQVLDRLGQEYTAAGKSDHFQALRLFLWGPDDTLGYEDVARQLGSTEGAVKVAVHRLRARYGQVLRDEIARTVEGPDEVEDEIRFLFEAFA